MAHKRNKNNKKKKNTRKKTITFSVMLTVTVDQAFCEI